MAMLRNVQPGGIGILSLCRSREEQTEQSGGVTSEGAGSSHICLVAPGKGLYCLQNSQQRDKAALQAPAQVSVL